MIFTFIITIRIPMVNMINISINRRIPLKTSFTAINATGLSPEPESLRIPFFLYLSPVVPFLIASIGENFFMILVERKPNNITMLTTAKALIILSTTDPLSEMSIVCLVFSISRSLNRNDIINPITAPITDITKYFTRYRPRIPLFGIPIAFMIPISRNSSLMVNDMVNLSMIRAMMIRQMLKTIIMAATAISSRYVSFKTSEVSINERLVHSASALLNDSVSSV